MLKSATQQKFNQGKKAGHTNQSSNNYKELTNEVKNDTI